MSLAGKTIGVLTTTSLAALCLADIERPCIGASHQVEAWGFIPAAGIPLDLACGEGSSGPILDTRPAPGLFNNHIINQPVPMGCGIPQPGLPIRQTIFDAAEVWNNATVAGTTQPASSFAIDGTNVTRFGKYPDWMSYPTSTLLLTDNRNQITFWEPEGTWLGFGVATLAVALVDTTGATITECDIAFNTTSAIAGGLPLYRFVEDNTSLGTTITTWSRTEVGNQQPIATDPALAWVDTFGAMVHELGHLAGLGHSLIDGPSNLSGSSTPSMFAEAQATTYAGPVTLQLQDCTIHAPTPVNGAVSVAGGILGVPARDLTPDDVAALAAAYPGPGQTQLGSISGRILTTIGPQRAAHVVAIDTSAPNIRRVGTFSDESGSFTIGSLLPGSYYVMAEWPDAPGYFAGMGMPEIADPAFGAGCGPYPAPFRTEFWDANESNLEPFPMAATPVTVSAAGSTAIGDIFVEGVAGVQLSAQACTNGGLVCGAPSQRGIVHRNLGAVSPTISMTVSGGTPLGLAILAFGVDHGYLPFSFGQLIEINPLPGGVLTLPFNAAGSATLSIPVGPSLVGANFYAQGGEFNLALNDIVLSNSLTLRLYDL